LGILLLKETGKGRDRMRYGVFGFEMVKGGIILLAKEKCL